MFHDIVAELLGKPVQPLKIVEDLSQHLKRGSGVKLTALGMRLTRLIRLAKAISNICSVK